MEQLSLVCEDADDSYIALTGLGESQFYWSKYNSMNSFKRAGSNGRNTVQAGSLVQASLMSMACVRDPYLEMAARLCFFVMSFIRLVG